MPYLIYLAILALGFWLGMVCMACLAGAGRRCPEPEPEPQSFTTLDLPLDPEAGGHPGSLETPRN
jgi:hypothetical protein